MTLLDKLKYLGAAQWTHVQLDEIGKEATGTIMDLVQAVRDARRELSNYDRDTFGGRNTSVEGCIADLDAVIAKALGTKGDQ